MRGSLAKLPGRTGILGYRPLDRDRVALVRWDPDLILRVGSRSNGSDLTGAGAAVLDTGDDFPWRRAAELHRTSSNPAFWGLNGPALGSRRVYAPCVNHLRHLRGSVGLWAAPSRTAAALRGGASPADAFPLLECTTEHVIRRKSIREAGQSLPSARGGRSRNGVTSAARLCGGAGRSSAVRGAGCLHELNLI